MKTLITAHSGCDGTPDNSLEFISHALRSGADALEVDVRAAQDGTLYLSHDRTDAACPKLSQAFQMLRSSPMRINCDLKQPGLEEAVLALAASQGVAGQLLFSGDVSTERMRRDPEVRSRALLNIQSIFPGEGGLPLEQHLEELVRACRACGAAVINVSYETCTPLVLERLREEGIGVSAWTVNEDPAARRLLDWGVYNITSRRPGMVLALREALRPRAPEFRRDMGKEVSAPSWES